MWRSQRFLFDPRQVTLTSFIFIGQQSSYRSSTQNAEGHRIVTPWKHWMNACEDYLEMDQDRPSGISLGDIQRYMLREFGLSFEKTSNLLLDLNKIGRVSMRDGKVILQRREADMP